MKPSLFARSIGHLTPGVATAPSRSVDVVVTVAAGVLAIPYHLACMPHDITIRMFLQFCASWYAYEFVAPLALVFVFRFYILSTWYAVWGRVKFGHPVPNFSDLHSS